MPFQKGLLFFSLLAFFKEAWVQGPYSCDFRNKLQKFIFQVFFLKKNKGKMFFGERICNTGAINCLYACHNKKNLKTY